MPITKTLTTPNGGSCAYHIAKSMSLDIINRIATVNVQSYKDQTGYLTGTSLIWNWTPSVSIAALTGNDLIAAIESALVTDTTSPFYQGAIAQTSDGTLDGTKVQQWALIKDARSLAEAQPFMYAGDLYDSNKEQISGSVVMAMLAKQASQPFSINWTLKDNTVKTLNADQMIGLGIALGQYITAIYDKARNYRQQINVATTVANVQNVVWVS